MGLNSSDVSMVTQHRDMTDCSQGGLAGLPVNRFVYISVCTPRGGTKMTPKEAFWIGEII